MNIITRISMDWSLVCCRAECCHVPDPSVQHLSEAWLANYRNIKHLGKAEYWRSPKLKLVPKTKLFPVKKRQSVGCIRPISCVEQWLRFTRFEIAYSPTVLACQPSLWMPRSSLETRCIGPQDYLGKNPYHPNSTSKTWRNRYHLKVQMLGGCKSGT